LIAGGGVRALHVKRAIVLTYPRTGSNYLLSLLNSHPNIHFHGEIFHREKIVTFGGRIKLEQKSGFDLHAVRENNVEQFLELAFSHPTNKQLRCRGYKHFLDHNRTALEILIAREDIGIILLERENRLASYSSKLIARQTGTWKSLDQPCEPATRLVFNAADFKAYCHNLNRKLDALHSRILERANVTSLEYTELSAPKVHRALLGFLGLPTKIDLGSCLFKQNTELIIDRFSNAEEAFTFLREYDRKHWSEYG
jgi:LPS sulfotransferase NodH